MRFILLLLGVFFSFSTVYAMEKLDEDQKTYTHYFNMAAPYSATCKIYGTGGAGTGTLITDDQGHIGIITAAHVGGNLTLSNPDGNAIIFTQKEIDSKLAFPQGSFVDIQTYTPEDNLQSFAAWPSDIVYLKDAQAAGDVNDIAVLIFKGDTLKALAAELKKRDISPINISKANAVINMDNPLDVMVVGYGQEEFRLGFKTKMVNDAYRLSHLSQEIHLNKIYADALELEELGKGNFDAYKDTIAHDSPLKKGMYFDDMTIPDIKDGGYGTKGDSGGSVYYKDLQGDLHLIAIYVTAYRSKYMSSTPGIGRGGFAPLLPHYDWFKKVLSETEVP